MQLLGDNGFVTAKRHQPLLEHDDAKGFHFSFLVFTSENSIEFSETEFSPAVFLVMPSNISVKQPKFLEPGATAYTNKDLMAQECPTRTFQLPQPAHCLISLVVQGEKSLSAWD